MERLADVGAADADRSAVDVPEAGDEPGLLRLRPGRVGQAHARAHLVVGARVRAQAGRVVDTGRVRRRRPGQLSEAGVDRVVAEEVVEPRSSGRSSATTACFSAVAQIGSPRYHVGSKTADVSPIA